jgi:ABC-type nickel/cobalt efflux system permease component RcnA
MNRIFFEIGSCVSFAMTEETQGRLIYAGTLLAVIFGCVLIAWLMAKRKHHKRKKKKHAHRWEEKPDLGRPHHGHSHGRRERTKRQPNPTLAETGGLPPRKAEAPPVSSPDQSA